MALLKYDETSRRYQFACAGTLLSATKILTAAQCVIHDNKYVIKIDIYLETYLDFIQAYILNANRIPSFDKFLVKLGVHFLNETTDDATLTMRINQVDIHENYDQETKVYRLYNKPQSDFITVINWTAVIIYCVIDFKIGQQHRPSDARVARQIHRQNFDRVRAESVPPRRSFRLRANPWMGKHENR